MSKDHIVLRYKALPPLFLTAMIGLSGTLSAAPNTAAIPIPLPPGLEPAKIELGKRLFQEPFFSKNLSASCASCHQLKNSGVDNLPQYIGMSKKAGQVNTPSVFNANLNFLQFWDGRAKTIDDVINDHIKDETVFANTWPTIVQEISQNSLYTADFKKIYPNGVTQDNIIDALSVYIDNLVTPNSSFDRFLKGDKTALSNEAQKGYRLFRKYGCITCHQGANLGGNLHQKLGIYKDYFADKGPLKKADYGYYNVTGKEDDKFVFKVPSLRNISRTGPYLHDGSVKTLPEMIQIMAIYQVGQPLRNDEVNSIAQFLQTFSADPAAKLITNNQTDK